MTDMEAVPCGHRYTEKSARDKLTRHRRRGDWGQSAWHCSGCGSWHVEDLFDIAPTCKACRGNGEHYDRHWRAGGSPSICQSCNGRGWVWEVAR